LATKWESKLVNLISFKWRRTFVRGPSGGAWSGKDDGGSWWLQSGWRADRRGWPDGANFRQPENRK
jgi:hypothetical protein